MIGKKLDMSHFYIFGNLLYYHVPSDSRKKMEPTTDKGIFMGYSEISKVTRVYIPTLMKKMIRSDVRLEEGRALRNSLEREKGATQKE